MTLELSAAVSTFVTHKSVLLSQQLGKPFSKLKKQTLKKFQPNKRDGGVDADSEGLLRSVCEQFEQRVKLLVEGQNKE